MVRAADLAIRNVTVLVAAGGNAVPDATVLIRGDRIAAVGPAAEISVPKEARVIDWGWHQHPPSPQTSPKGK